MTFDPSEWLDEPKVADPTAVELEAAGRTARLALFNTVKAAFISNAQKLSRREVATRLRTSPQAVSRLLRQPNNMTIETAARLLFVLGKELRVTAVRPGAHCQPFAFHTADEMQFGQRILFRDISQSGAHSDVAACVFISSGRRFIMMSGGRNATDGIYQQLPETLPASSVRQADAPDDQLTLTRRAVLRPLQLEGTA